MRATDLSISQVLARSLRGRGSLIKIYYGSNMGIVIRIIFKLCSIDLPLAVSVYGSRFSYLHTKSHMLASQIPNGLAEPERERLDVRVFCCRRGRSGDVISVNKLKGELRNQTFIYAHTETDFCNSKMFNLNTNQQRAVWQSHVNCQVNNC